MDGVGEVAHAPHVDVLHDAVLAFHDFFEGIENAFAGVGGKLRRKKEQGFKLPHENLLVDLAARA